MLLIFNYIVKGKKIIIIAMVISLIISLLLSSLVTERWETYSIISKPKLIDYKKLYIKSKLIEDFVGNSYTSEIERFTSSENLLNDFIETFNSDLNKTSFIESNITLLSDATAHHDFLFYKKIAGDIRVEKNGKNYTLSFQAKTAEISYKFFNSYLAYIENKVNSDLVDRVNVILSSSKKRHINKIEEQSERIKNRADKEILKTQLSLDIAKKAGQIKPIENVYDTSSQVLDFGYGENLLSSKLKTLKNNIDKSKYIYSNEKDEIQFKLDSLNKINFSNLNIQPFNIVEPAYKPEIKIFPNKKNIVFFGLFIGFILGFMIVIIRSNLLENGE